MLNKVLKSVLNVFPLQWLKPQAGSTSAEYVTEEKLRSRLVGLGATFRFLPVTDSYTEETAEMRRVYRVMLRDPIVKASLYTKILAVAQLEVQAQPPTDRTVDKDAAEFVKYALTKCRGGMRQIVMAIATGGLLDGFSVCDKVWKSSERGKYRGKWVLKALKSKDTEYLDLIGDDFRNVTAVRDKRTGEEYDASNFAIYSHMGLFEAPTGSSDLRAAYRAYWLIDTAWQLRSVALERFTLPMLKGTYQTKDQKGPLEEALELARSQTWMSLPAGAQVEALNLATRGPEDFASAIRDLREDIAIGITGAVLQMLQGQVADARGSSVVHKSTAELLQWALAAEVADVINDQIVPMLVDWNFRDAEYPTITLGGVDDNSMMGSVNLDNTLLQMGLPLSRKEMYKKYGRQQPADLQDTLVSPQIQSMKMQEDMQRQQMQMQMGGPPGGDPNAPPGQPPPDPNAPQDPNAQPAQLAEGKPDFFGQGGNGRQTRFRTGARLRKYAMRVQKFCGTGKPGRCPKDGSVQRAKKEEPKGRKPRRQMIAGMAKAKEAKAKPPTPPVVAVVAVAPPSQTAPPNAPPATPLPPAAPPAPPKPSIHEARSGFQAVLRQPDGTYHGADGPIAGDAHERIKALKIPPAWRDVEVAADPASHLVATGRDAKGRLQRLYSAQHAGEASAKKFMRLKALASKLHDLEPAIKEAMAGPAGPAKEAAAALLVMRHSGVRIGGTKDTLGDVKAHGLTNLTAKHVTFSGKKATLTFVGKKGVKQVITVSHPDAVAALQERKKTAKRNQPLFNASDATVRAYLKTVGASFVPKDFRTLVANEHAAEAAKLWKRPAATEAEAKKRRRVVAAEVAKRLGNTPAVALKSYILPEVFDAPAFQVKAAKAVKTPTPKAPAVPADLGQNEFLPYEGHKLPGIAPAMLQRILQKNTGRYNFDVGFAKEHGWASDGRFLMKLPVSERANLPVSLHRFYGRELDMTRNIMNEKHEPAPAKITGWHPTSKTGRPRVLLHGPNGKTAALDARYVQAIQSRYPGVTFHLPARGDRHAVFAKNGDGIVGVIAQALADNASIRTGK